MREIAGDVMAYMQANNYEVADAGETITFRGKIAASKSQAFFLSFVTLVCLGIFGIGPADPVPGRSATTGSVYVCLDRMQESSTGAAPRKTRIGSSK